MVIIMTILLRPFRKAYKSKKDFTSIMERFGCYVFFNRRTSEKLHDARIARIILLKGWSLCSPRLEQHRLPRGKNPRKSFLSFPRPRRTPSAVPPWHKSLSFPHLVLLLLHLRLFISPSFQLSLSVLFARTSLISLLQVRRLSADGKAGK